MVEYIDQEISTLSWQSGGDSTNIITGSKKYLSVWQVVGTPGAVDQLPIVESTREKADSSIIRAFLLGNVALSASSSGIVTLHEFVDGPTKHLKLVSKSTKLHPGYNCQDFCLCPQTNCIISCGDDGAISKFHIETAKKKESRVISESSLKCLDMVTPNEVILGTLSGCLKYIDLRTYECISTFANQNLSALNCVRRNPNVNHLAVGGNDQGSLLLYDLRNINSTLAQISAHNSAVTCVRYRPKDANVLYSSSCDGELFKWSLSAESIVNHTPIKVESIACTGGPISITSFDINNQCDIAYSTDHGAIFYCKTNG